VLIMPLAVPCVDLIVIAVVLAVVLVRMRWVTQQPEASHWAIWITDGGAPIVVGVASNSYEALRPAAAVGGKTSVAE
jgi:hypothetical protein